MGSRRTCVQKAPSGYPVEFLQAVPAELLAALLVLFVEVARAVDQTRVISPAFALVAALSAFALAALLLRRSDGRSGSTSSFSDRAEASVDLGTFRWSLLVSILVIVVALACGIEVIVELFLLVVVLSSGQRRAIEAPKASGLSLLLLLHHAASKQRRACTVKSIGHCTRAAAVDELDGRDAKTSQSESSGLRVGETL
jgi:hypothetical protein